MPQKKVGGLAGIRTLDKCLKRALLYQLSYQPNLLSGETYRRLQQGASEDLLFTG